MLGNIQGTSKVSKGGRCHHTATFKHCSRSRFCELFLPTDSSSSCTNVLESARFFGVRSLVLFTPLYYCLRVEYCFGLMAVITNGIIIAVGVGSCAFGIAKYLQSKNFSWFILVIFGVVIILHFCSVLLYQRRVRKEMQRFVDNKYS